MRCEAARPLISAGLDGELDAERSAKLRTHLDECVPCSTEREAVAATVRLLRALPEAEPPAALRQRIDRALVEMERSAVSRRPGLGWLIRSRTPGWAWGAAAGAAAASVVLFATRGHRPTQRIVVLPPRATVPVMGPPPAPKPSLHTQRPKLAITVRKKPAAAPSSSRPLDQIARASAPEAPASTAPPAEAAPPAPPAPTHRHAVHRLAGRRLLASVHRLGPMLARLSSSPHPAPAPRVAPAEAPGRSTNDGGHGLHNRPPAPPDTSMPATPDPDPSDTDGMTTMASRGDMPSPPASEDDDLVELRRRLIDRPLQIPELGRLKPDSRSDAARDGWIRF